MILRFHLRSPDAIREKQFLEACADAYKWRKQAERLKKALENEQCCHVDDLAQLQKKFDQVIEDNARLAGALVAAEAALELRKLWS